MMIHLLDYTLLVTTGRRQYRSARVRLLKAYRQLPDRLSLLVDGLEVVVKRPVGELSAQVPGCDVRGAEVEPVPHPGVDDILQQGAAGIVVTQQDGHRGGDGRQLRVLGV